MSSTSQENDPKAHQIDEKYAETVTPSRIPQPLARRRNSNALRSLYAVDAAGSPSAATSSLPRRNTMSPTSTSSRLPRLRPLSAMPSINAENVDPTDNVITSRLSVNQVQATQDALVPVSPARPVSQVFLVHGSQTLILAGLASFYFLSKSQQGLAQPTHCADCQP